MSSKSATYAELYDSLYQSRPEGFGPEEAPSTWSGYSAAPPSSSQSGTGQARKNKGGYFRYSLRELNAAIRAVQEEMAASPRLLRVGPTWNDTYISLKPVPQTAKEFEAAHPELGEVSY